METDSTTRFSSRVDNYVKYRPTYPLEVLNYLKDECNLVPSSIIADVGAGTGIFTKLLLNEGYKVYAVEPNRPMLDAAIEQLSIYEKFTPIIATASSTTLADNGIDIIVCAQAFHWFSNNNTRIEFNRILKGGAKAALIWNNRLIDADAFLKGYDELLKNDSIDYNKVNHQNLKDVDFKSFFKNGDYTLKKFPNEQVFDFDGLAGRAFSSSYAPQQDTPEGDEFLVLLKGLFDKYNVEGKVSFKYQTEVYLGEV